MGTCVPKLIPWVLSRRAGIVEVPWSLQRRTVWVSLVNPGVCEHDKLDDKRTQEIAFEEYVSLSLM